MQVKLAQNDVYTSSCALSRFQNVLFLESEVFFHLFTQKKRSTKMNIVIKTKQVVSRWFNLQLLSADIWQQKLWKNRWQSLILAIMETAPFGPEISSKLTPPDMRLQYCKKDLGVVGQFHASAIAGCAGILHFNFKRVWSPMPYWGIATSRWGHWRWRGWAGRGGGGRRGCNAFRDALLQLLDLLLPQRDLVLQLLQLNGQFGLHLNEVGIVVELLTGQWQAQEGWHGVWALVNVLLELLGLGMLHLQTLPLVHRHFLQVEDMLQSDTRRYPPLVSLTALSNRTGRLSHS